MLDFVCKQILVFHMKTKVNVISLFTLTVLFAVSIAWSAEVGNLSGNSTSGWYINLPSDGTINLDISTSDITAGKTSFKVYDDGGIAGTTTNYNTKYLIITAPSGRVFQVKGKITGYDNTTGTVKIYDGNSSAAILATQSAYNGDASLKLTYTTGNTVGISLYGGRHDLELDISVLDGTRLFDIEFAENIIGGNATVVGDATATVSTEISLNLLSNTNYLPIGVEVESSDGNPVEVKMTSSFDGNASFFMPYGVATVIPQFTNNLTAVGGLFAYLPKSGTETINIPAGVKSFKIYDDGGPDNNYSSGANGKLELVAPTGYTLVLTGTIRTQYYSGSPKDYLNVYNSSGTAIASGLMSKEYHGVPTEIGPYVSVESMTIGFVSDNSSEYAGLDLTVEVISTTTYYTVSVNQKTGGTLTASPTSAQYATTVKLTPSLTNGYLIKDINVQVCCYRYY